MESSVVNNSNGTNLLTSLTRPELKQPEIGITSPARGENKVAHRRKLFGDCALIEIIHLHECLRGAIKALEKDVDELSRFASQGKGSQLEKLERRVAGRFKVIWSVFRAHSSAEDEFIWPALQSKTQGRVEHHSPKYRSFSVEQQKPSNTVTVNSGLGADVGIMGYSGEEDLIVQSEYEEDHASEEIMFETIDSLLAKLRKVLLEQKDAFGTRKVARAAQAAETAVSIDETCDTSQSLSVSTNEIHDTTQALSKHTQSLSEHLYNHLEKEENQCMPLVVKHFSRREIHDLVGNIMGKRSSDMIAQIMTMAVQNLTQDEQEEMVKYMKQAMEGTFFDRWLSMSGWMESPSARGVSSPASVTSAPNLVAMPAATAAVSSKPRTDPTKRPAGVRTARVNSRVKRQFQGRQFIGTPAPFDPKVPINNFPGANITGQAELERLIRAVATNPALTPTQKNNTIQGLRNSVWKSSQKQTGNSEQGDHAFAPEASVISSALGSTAVGSAMIKMRRATPPSVYLKRSREGEVEFVWSSEASRCPNDGSVPLFSAAELAPTFHDGATGAVLGCPHYARACKLRHPDSGRLYTCRLCCEQEREMPMKDKDDPLDRYAVTEIMCMKCNALQPADDRCMNPSCESYGKAYAKYFCRICHLYDDRSRPIFHCPYCNTCRMGLGLGIDFRHCMRCNACVSLADDDHRCIPQKLQGSCPICHESMFSSTEPLRGLKCGHVLHLSCFSKYRRGHSYTCPLCQRSMEDMKDHFALLDAAVRMQPMPTAYLTTMSNIYCQDCGKTGQVPYHFVGQKCPHLQCGSYNTREIGRVQNPPSSSQHLT